MDQNLKKIIESGDLTKINELILKKRFKPDIDIIEPKQKKIETIHVNRENSLYVDLSQIHHYGVFTKYKIAKDSVIELCYCIELEFRDKYHKDKTILNYSYALYSGDNEITNHGHKLMLLTGNGMLYNHNDNPKAQWVWLLEERKAMLVALQDIEQNSEITIDYGYGYWKRLLK